MSNEHWHLCAILANVEDLFRFVIVRIEINFRLAKDCALASHHVVTVDGCWRGETGEGIEGLSVSSFAAKTTCRAQSRKLNLAYQISFGAIDLHLSVSVFQVTGYEHMVNKGDALQCLGCFRHNRFPVLSFRKSNVDRYDLTSSRRKVRLKPEEWSIIANKVVGGIKVVKQFNDLRIPCP